MCVPDLRGSQGSFTYFTTDAEKAGKHTGGEVLLVERHGDVVVGELPGPANPFTAAHEDLTIPFVARVDEDDGRVWFDFGGNELTLGLREYSDWLTADVSSGTRRQGQGHRPAVRDEREAALRALRDADQHRPGEPRDAHLHAGHVRAVPREAQRELRDARARRGHVGLERAYDRRDGVPRADVPHPRRAREDVPQLAQEEPERAHGRRVRRDRPHPAHASSATSTSGTRRTAARTPTSTGTRSRTSTCAWTSSSRASWTTWTTRRCSWSSRTTGSSRSGAAST